MPSFNGRNAKYTASDGGALYDQASAAGQATYNLAGGGALYDQASCGK
eukprot:gene8918-26080_t